MRSARLPWLLIPALLLLHAAGAAPSSQQHQRHHSRRHASGGSASSGPSSGPGPAPAGPAAAPAAAAASTSTAGSSASGSSADDAPSEAELSPNLALLSDKLLLDPDWERERDRDRERGRSVLSRRAREHRNYSQPDPHDPLLITTKSGQVRGTTFMSSTGKEVDAWLGIPYAEKPIGEWPRSDVDSRFLSCTLIAVLCLFQVHTGSAILGPWSTGVPRS